MGAWLRLRAAEGNRATIIDLYELAAAPQGLAAHELPVTVRLSLARQAVPQIWPGFSITDGSDRPAVRTGTNPGFVPASHHTTVGELAGITGDTLRRWAIPQTPISPRASDAVIQRRADVTGGGS
jgi:hypothetical protein